MKENKMNFKNKMKKSGGFTLIEMLIVVAIIAILVVVSIPMVLSGLNKAKVAADSANERAAKAAALIQYMTGDAKQGTSGDFVFDAAKGELVAKDQEGTVTGYGQCKDHKDDHLNVTIDADGNVTMKWSKGGAMHTDVTKPAA